MTKFRPIRKDDVKDFYGDWPKYTVRGFSAEDDGKVIAIGGVYYEGDYAVAFAEMMPEMRSRKKDIARAARMLTAFYKSLNRKVFAVPSRKEKTAKALLVKLGFVDTGKTCEHGEVMILEV